MPETTRPPVVNVADVLADPGTTVTNPRRDSFEARLGLIGKALGTRGLGINVTVVPPGSRAFPRHYHYVNDELFVILEGTGMLHYGEADHPLKPMDVVSILAGTGIPFQIDNTGETEMRYLAVSMMVPADVFHYPDSDKYGIMAAGVPFRDLSSDGKLPRFARWIDPGMSVHYWLREVTPGHEDGSPET